MLAVVLALLLADAAPTTAPAGEVPAIDKVVAGARPASGLFKVWTRDDKSWLELSPADLGRQFVVSWILERGTGEGALYSGLMPEGAPAVLAAFRVLGGCVQLVSLNHRVLGTAGGARESARNSFAESLLGTAPIVGRGGPGGAVLVELAPLFLVDALDLTRTLEQQYRQPYTLDVKSSDAVRTHAHPDGDSFLATLHFSLPREVLPPLLPPGVPPSVPVDPPLALNDVRSLFLGVRTNFHALPQTPARPRVADERIGAWITTQFDFDDERLVEARLRLVSRWRLEKQVPGAAPSRPKQPIVLWLDRSIPAKFRATVRAGALEWNKAFEPLGLLDANEVRDELPVGEGSLFDGRHAAIFWFTAADPFYVGLGAQTVDPRTGEVLGAKVLLLAQWMNQVREHGGDVTHGHVAGRHGRCEAGEGLAEESALALGALAARGIDPDGPEAQALMLASLKNLTMHEVGHVLGLRHNFRGSATYTLARLEDSAFTRAHGLGGSVMDYSPANLAAPGGKQGEYFGSTIGAYDKWAIEYLYRPFASAEEERAGLSKIAARAAEPELAFATDDDIPGFGLDGRDMDPTVNRWDLGSEPFAHSRRRFALARELLASLPTAQAPDGYPAKLRASVELAFKGLARSSRQIAKWVGGVEHVRDRQGGRPPFAAVPAERQRAALDLLNQEVFAAGAISAERRGLDRLQIDFFAREDGWPLDPSLVKPALFPFAERVSEVSGKVLERLLSAPVLARVAEGEATDPGALRTAELFGALDRGIWGEAAAAADVVPLRRTLQRDYTRRLAALLLDAPPGLPEDARTEARQSLLALKASLRAALGKKGLPLQTRAHFAETLARVDEALAARMERRSK